MELKFWAVPFVYFAAIYSKSYEKLIQFFCLLLASSLWNNKNTD